MPFYLPRKIFMIRSLRAFCCFSPLPVCVGGVGWGEGIRYQIQVCFFLNYFWLHVVIGPCTLAKALLQGELIITLKLVSSKKRYFSKAFSFLSQLQFPPIYLPVGILKIYKSHHKLGTLTILGSLTWKLSWG